MALATLKDFELTGKRLFMRVDFNVALTPEKTIIDDTRIRAALPSIQYARDKGAKIILGSHLGRPKGKIIEALSLQPIANHLANLLGTPVIFPDTCVGPGVENLVNQMREGEILLLENLRFHPGETTNDAHFAKKLAKFTDLYINEAFGTMHRAHASTAALPQKIEQAGIGFLVQKELKYLNRVIQEPQHPFVTILGGNKISDKISVIRHLLPRVDHLLIVGGMAYTFLKDAGYDIGRSVVEEDKLALAHDLKALAKEHKTQMLFPVDHVVADAFKNDANRKTLLNKEMCDPWMGLDIGPLTIEQFKSVILQAKTIFWNGPAGVCEMENFRHGTLALAQLIAQSQAVSVVGGGDSVGAIKQLGMEEHFDLISTGGGATLEFLSGKTLPGLTALVH